MKAYELPLAFQHTWTFEQTTDAARTGEAPPRISVRSEVRLQYSELLEELRVTADGLTWAVKAVTQDAADVKLLLGRALPYIAWVTSIGATTFTVQVHVFPMNYRLPEAFSLGVDEEIVDRVRALKGVELSADQVVEILADDIAVPALPDGLPRFLYVGSPNRHPDSEKFLRLLGKRFNIDVAFQDGQWLVIYVTMIKNKRVTTSPVTLLEAAWTFRNVTLAAKDRERLQALTSEAIQDQRSYLKLWQQYQEVEQRQGQRLARQLGAMPYTERPEYRAGFWTFRVTATPEQLAMLRQQPGLTLRATELRPLDLEDAPVPASGRRPPQEFIGEFSSDPHGAVRVLPLGSDESTPPPSGWLSLSLAGDKAQFERRDRARLAIEQAKTAMPQLALLLEGKEVPQRRLHREPALPPHSQAAAAFRGTPTERQIEALEVALNTPDIALIQGPPGTGKTRVIAALQQRLADVAKDRAHLPGHILLTSAQHAAVENAVAATQVFGLPAVKLGKNRRFKEDFSDGVDHWRQDMISHLRSRLSDAPEQPLEVKFVRLRDEVLRVTTSPSPKDDLQKVVRHLLSTGGEHLKPRTQEQLQEWGDELGPDEIDQEEREYLLTAVRALRTVPEAFEDDGPRMAQRCLRRLEDTALPVGLTREDKAVLSAGAQWADEGVPPFLDTLAEVKERLLVALQPQLAAPLLQRADRAAVELLNTALEELRQAARKEKGGIQTVLYDMLASLENDPDGTRESVKNYTAVLAATCQQSDSYTVRQIRTALGNQTRTFDNVVIDEAARVHPLDLLIPMSQAQRRIILVGDHRQLPHLLEPDVERELQAGWLDKSVQEANEDALHQSLFERLFTILRQHEQRDGIRRVVTLDQQYRMHPVLGQFVSDTFYTSHNPSEAFSSGRPAEEFEHGLAPYGGAVAAWMDVPYALGGERGRQSKFRPVEAQVVAKEAERLLQLRPDLSIGVISFYADQVKEIRKAMEKLGLTERGEDGEYRIHPGFQETYDLQGRSRERLRVGTVDAFQGMEFDVVLLSLTRSNTLPSQTPEQQRRRYGHLTLENRLCVAMSRQQRLLILVGDAGMLPPDEERSAVPALDRFYQLCKGAYGHIVPA
ncbi:DEAD/DEAH box helicase [Deinococcus petrolearius]|uniref:DEAD/DEAH box helicase n=1 Tax=Deinococcus petrolearius TaxID=1751295 RepID=A0ABW1DKK5_9DEIO